MVAHGFLPDAVGASMPSFYNIVFSKVDTMLSMCEAPMACEHARVIQRNTAMPGEASILLLGLLVAVMSWKSRNQYSLSVRMLTALLIAPTGLLAQ
jgi:hypothetical protein